MNGQVWEEGLCVQSITVQSRGQTLFPCSWLAFLIFDVVFLGIDSHLPCGAALPREGMDGETNAVNVWPDILQLCYSEESPKPGDISIPE